VVLGKNNAMPKNVFFSERFFRMTLGAALGGAFFYATAVLCSDSKTTQKTTSISDKLQYDYDSDMKNLYEAYKKYATMRSEKASRDFFVPDLPKEFGAQELLQWALANISEIEKHTTHDEVDPFQWEGFATKISTAKSAIDAAIAVVGKDMNANCNPAHVVDAANGILKAKQSYNGVVDAFMEKISEDTRFTTAIIIESAHIDRCFRVILLEMLQYIKEKTQDNSGSYRDKLNECIEALKKELQSKPNSEKPTEKQIDKKPEEKPATEPSSEKSTDKKSEEKSAAESTKS
jgi:hypothetical protein